MVHNIYLISFSQNAIAEDQRAKTVRKDELGAPIGNIVIETKISKEQE